MAKNALADLSNTASSNTDIIGQDVQGSANVSGGDNALRNVAKLLADFYDSIGGTATVSGTDTYTVTVQEQWAAYATGLVLAIKVANANTGASTLNVTPSGASALGAKAIRRQGDSALSAADMVANGVYLLRYDEAYNAAAGAWVLLNPASSGQPLDADLTAIAATGVSVTSGLLYGLTLSNNATDATNDIDIAAGVAMDSTNAKYMTLAAGITKRLDAAWAVGTNQGGLDTGAIANVWYYMWLIMRSDTGVVDVLFSTSASAPTMPANYDYKRRIGAIQRSGGAIQAFVQTGDHFDRTPGNNVQEFSTTNPGTSSVTVSLTAVPAIVGITAKLAVRLLDPTPAAETFARVAATSAGAPDLTNFTHYIPASGATVPAAVSGPVQVQMQTAQQIVYRVSASPADLVVTCITTGWIDTRGRLA